MEQVASQSSSFALMPAALHIDPGASRGAGTLSSTPLNVVAGPKSGSMLKRDGSFQPMSRAGVWCAGCRISRPWPMTSQYACRLRTARARKRAGCWVLLRPAEKKLMGSWDLGSHEEEAAEEEAAAAPPAEEVTGKLEAARLPGQQQEAAAVADAPVDAAGGCICSLWSDSVGGL
jgi:hypothetical protein